MFHLSSLKLKCSGKLEKYLIYFNLFFLCIFSSCLHKNTAILTNYEKEKIDSFLKDLLIENTGIYTLYGDKPISEILLYTGNLEELNADEYSERQEDTLLIDSEVILNQVANWKIWKKHAKSLNIKKFGFVDISPPGQNLYCFYYIINFEAARKVIKDNLQDFKTRLGIDLNNYKNALIDPRSVIWTKGCSDHYLMGLLYGFGKENAEYFVNKISIDEYPNNFEIVKGPYNQNNLPIPVYASSAKDKQKEKFYQQRDQIQKLLKDKVFLDEVIGQLTK